METPEIPDSVPDVVMTEKLPVCTWDNIQIRDTSGGIHRLRRFSTLTISHNGETTIYMSPDD